MENQISRTLKNVHEIVPQSLSVISIIPLESQKCPALVSDTQKGYHITLNSQRKFKRKKLYMHVFH